MVEVDPKLFVTCRLCLDVEGQFQIVPIVQHQIKYCFDIEVEPFDGLPQLICKKCENILSDYYSKKKKFIEKQTELKNNVQGNAKKIKRVTSPLQPENSDHSNNQDRITKEKKIKRNKRIKRKRLHRISSSSDNESVTNNSFVPALCIEKSECTENNFNEYFICRICAQQHQTEEFIKHHLKEHNNLLFKFRNVFNKSCLVAMEKFDNKANIINSDNGVVYDSETIILNTQSPYYYSLYNLKNRDFTQIDVNTQDAKHSTESDSEIQIESKRQRLVSRSSGDTVVLGENFNRSNESNEVSLSNKKIPPVIDCIDIDDSSDSTSTKSDEKQKSENKSAEVISKKEETFDYKPIHTIVKVCHHRYLRRNGSAERDNCKKKKTGNNRLTDSLLLQHKILSMGRKIITNKGFNCTGLLRFMEYKNLNVVWKELNHINASKEGKYIRISTKIKGNTNTETKYFGWKNIDEFVKSHEVPEETLNLLGQLRASNFNHANTVREEVTISQPVLNLPRISTVFSHADKDLNKAAMDSESQFKKLLNRNPVSNPKQLPKKGNNEFVPFNITKVYSAAVCNKLSLDANQENENAKISADDMPATISNQLLVPKVTINNDSVASNVITIDGTLASNVIMNRSLEHHTDKNTDPVNSSLNNESQTSYPRIKVKPVSELMPQKVTGNINTEENYILKLNETQNVLTFNDKTSNKDIMGHSVTLSNIWSVQNDTLNQQKYEANNATHPSSTIDREYVILDTVEFPNTRTYSPFKYFKNLLRVHNIILLDSDKPLPQDASCLVSLQLGFQQENCMPVNLRLALFCHKNTFCIKIQDSKLEDVNINTLTANWQWELLKICKNNAGSKVFQNAQKISQDTFHFTKSFFSLLKCINLKKHVSGHHI